MNYYYKSEFELLESFLDAAGDPVDITNIDIEIVYYTPGWVYPVSILIALGLLILIYLLLKRYKIL
jgi:hypothetical protein